MTDTTMSEDDLGEDELAEDEPVLQQGDRLQQLRDEAGLHDV